ncbi:MAG: hypothetical protein J7M25_03175 [Deltaproteobacteria bacterium]|nr:hypothetical protein [Deltaproteobacteria bacterium]
MSHQKASWILSLAAFVLFALACTIGRYATQPSTKLPTATAAALSGALTTTRSPEKPFARSRNRVMEDFYGAQPELQGRIPPVLEAAVRIKLISLEPPTPIPATAPSHRGSAAFVAEVQ